MNKLPFIAKLCVIGVVFYVQALWVFMFLSWAYTGNTAIILEEPNISILLIEMVVVLPFALYGACKSLLE